MAGIQLQQVPMYVMKILIISHIQAVANIVKPYFTNASLK